MGERATQRARQREAAVEIDTLWRRLVGRQEKRRSGHCFVDDTAKKKKAKSRKKKKPQRLKQRQGQIVLQKRKSVSKGFGGWDL